MLATDILTQDHKEVLGLIAKLQTVEITPGANADTFNKIKGAVLMHLQAEEEVYYPALTQHEEFSDLLETSLPEHEAVRKILADLSNAEITSSEFLKGLAELSSAITEHAAEEENDVFPKSIEVLGVDKIEALSSEITRVKKDSEIVKAAKM